MKFYFESYGCTMNHGEAKIMEDIVRARGHDIVVDEEESEVLVLVTCTVIETTELRMLKRLKELTQTGKMVVVAGCMASVQKDQILQNNPDALILTPQYLKDMGKVADILAIGEERPKMSREYREALKKSADAIIPISSGCLGSCTYCITKLARGSLQSHTPDILIEGMKKVLSEGFKEIRLTSQDTAAYGADIESNLPNLLKNIGEIQGEFRVRVGMMNPENVKPILPEMLDAYSDPRIYKFLHLPVQSGNEEILKQMGRGYSISDYLYVVDGFREAFSDLTLSTDVIVGFPGETDSDFKDTVDLIKKLRPNILNITRFSPRPLTLAKDMENKIPSRIAKERSRELTKVQLAISREINSTLVGRKERILICEPGKPGTMMGRTNTYLPVVVKDTIPLCDFVDVEIIESKDTYLIGKIL
jgi:MiaB-like tRNA modifying enzyme